ncbi:MAG: hypothetical protein D8M58_17930 [Calditrichaeota bacterium]|nr:MAG: hypothetical protein DWQ03_01845 [Calditrichota bacterium]MBL1207288.1 hypothetical protein [Calditrichota bacterium]NOG47120.1 hypothetical protein [Calditrichota bacterium]
MEFNEIFFGERDFYTEQNICKYIRYSKKFSSENELDFTKGLLFFSSSLQRTWLVVSNERLYCILDDKRVETPHINWSIKKKKLLQNDTLLINLNVRDKSKNSGIIDFGEKHKNWLFSERLFLYRDVEDVIEDFILKNMNVSSSTKKDREEGESDVNN